MPGPLLLSRLLVAWLLWQVPGHVTASIAQEVPASSTEVKTDLYGDPLPKGAIARLGTIRFRHGGWYLTNVTFLPDSATTITTTSGDSEIVFWEATTGKRLRDIRTDPMGIQGLALSHDGKKIAVGGFWYPEDRSKGAMGELRVLDTATGATIRAFPRESRDANHLGLGFSKDGRLLFSIGNHGILRVEEIASGAEILQQKFQGDNTPALNLSPDGKTLAIVSGPNVRKFFLWDWQAGAEPREIKTFSGQDGGGILVFSPDGRHVAWCDSGSEPLHVWEVKSGKLVARLPLPNLDDSWAGSLIFSPDGKKLVAPAGPNRAGRVDIWNTTTWKLERHLDVAARQIAISPDSRLLTTGARMFIFDSGEEIGGIDGAHRGQIGQILNAPGGQVITSSDDGSIRIWDPLSGRHVRKLLHENWVRGIAISPDGQRLVSSSLDDTVRLFDLRNAKEIYRLPGHGRQGGRRAVTFIADGQSFASFGDDYYLRIWDVRTGKALAEHLIQPTGVKVPGENDERDGFEFLFLMEGARFTPRGKYLLLAAQRKIHVFDVASGKELRMFEREGSALTSMEISPDERQLLTSSWGKQLELKLPDGSTLSTTEKENIVTLWDLESGKSLLTFRSAGGGGAAAFAPDGEHFAIATNRPKNHVAIYDLQGARQQVVEDIPSQIHSVQISGEGKLIVGLDDTSALVYDLRIPVKK